MWKARFNKIYLVATGNASTSEHRVTEREGKARPLSIQFTITGVESTDIPIGTLVLSEELWSKMFEGRKVMQGMETAKSAAHKLVKSNSDIYYGCPLCNFRTKDLEPHTKHINEHVSRLIDYLDIELSEELND